MKKRRELDALAGKTTRRKKGQHELLMNNSESSEMEEFSLPQKMNVRKNSVTCGKLLPVCAMLLLLGCMAAIGLLTWLHIQLKQDMAIMREQLKQEQTKLITDTQQQMSQLSKAQISNLTVLNHLQKNFTDTMKEVGDLKEKYRVLSQFMSAAPKLTSLPDNVHELSQNVAGFGSKMTTVQADLDDLKVKLTALETTLRQMNTSSEPQVKASPGKQAAESSPTPDTSALTVALQNYVTQEVNKISQNMAHMNETVTMAANTVDRLRNHERKLEVLRNFTTLLEGRLSQVEGRLIPIEGRLSQIEKTSLNDSHLIPLQYQVVNISSTLQSLASLSDVELCKELLQNYINTTDKKLMSIEERLRLVTEDESTSRETDGEPVLPTLKTKLPDKTQPTSAPVDEKGADKLNTETREDNARDNKDEDVEGDLSEREEEGVDGSEDVDESEDVDDEPSTTTLSPIRLSEESVDEVEHDNLSKRRFRNVAELQRYFEQHDPEHRGYLTEDAVSGLDIDVTAADVNMDGRFTLVELAQALHLSQPSEEEETRTNLDKDDLHDLLNGHDTDV